MAFLRSIAADLVEKKLWPIAVALVVALVAIPVVLGKGATDADPVPVPTPATGAPAAKAAVAVETAELVKRVRPGAVRNPFVQRFVKNVDTTAEKAPDDKVKTDAPKGSAPKTDPAKPVTTTKPKTETKPDEQDLYRVELDFGQPGEQKRYTNLARLTPLPSAEAPVIVFLGIKEDGRTATFLVSSDATPSGDGECAPSEAACETIDVKPGDTVFFDVAIEGTTETVQFQLDLERVRKTTAATTATARAAHLEESKSGRELLRVAKLQGTVAVLDELRYSARYGVLVPVPAAGESTP